MCEKTKRKHLHETPSGNICTIGHQICVAAVSRRQLPRVTHIFCFSCSKKLLFRAILLFVFEEMAIFRYHYLELFHAIFHMAMQPFVH